MYATPSAKTEGFFAAVAGGALLVSALLELIEPAQKEVSQINGYVFILLGAITFSLLDYWAKEKKEAKHGSGSLLAITLDGIPENLALGVSLIVAEPNTVSALAASIFNLPEAAGSVKEMVDNGMPKTKVIWLCGFKAPLFWAIRYWPTLQRMTWPLYAALPPVRS